MRDALRHHRAHRAEGDFGDGLAQRLANKIAEGIGTTLFLGAALFLIAIWIIINGGYAYFSGALKHLETGSAFDPAPWILLNLIFSFEAFFTGSLVVIAAKAQAKRDRAREEADAKHREEIAAENVALLQVNTDLTKEIRKLSADVHAHILGEDK